MSAVLLPVVVNCQQKQASYELIEIAQSDRLWTGVAVSKEGRIFVNYPRWSPNPGVSVAEINPSGEATAYPAKQWNEWDLKTSPEDYLVCVQSVYIDKNNYLWILDTGLDVRQGIIEKGPKLLKVNLQTNQVEQKILVNPSAAPPMSYLNDIRVDTKSDYAYITDSGLGAIVVINLKTEEARRTLTEHSSTKAEGITLTVEGKEWNRQIHSDGIALDGKGEYLYYQALSGYSLYRIHTKWLKNNSLTEEKITAKVELLGKPGAADGIAFGIDGNLYLTSLEYNAIRRFSPDKKVEMVIQDSRLKWPDSFSVTPNGDIYVTTSQLHLAGKHSEPFKILKLQSLK
jgi:sugar lactone lactonase YvrE